MEELEAQPNTIVPGYICYIVTFENYPRDS